MSTPGAEGRTIRTKRKSKRLDRRRLGRLLAKEPRDRGPPVLLHHGYVLPDYVRRDYVLPAACRALAFITVTSDAMSVPPITACSTCTRFGGLGHKLCAAAIRVSGDQRGDAAM